MRRSSGSIPNPRPALLLSLCLALFSFAGVWPCAAQDTPLLSGGMGFLTKTNAGATSYQPIIEPLAAAPIGQHFLVETRGAILESFSPKGGNQPGYNHSHFAAMTYLQGDYLASSHLTVVGGSFLTPFATYNERLSPVWISNFQDGPLIAGLGLMSTGVGVGGELRGSAYSNDNVAIDYTGYFSARSANKQFASDRSTGMRLNLYAKKVGLEVGTSYGRLLQGTQENFYGTHLWWRPLNTAFQFRSEYARGKHAQGYWFEASYRTKAFGGLDSWVGRFEPLFRMQQVLRIDKAASDGVAGVGTQRVDFGLDYNFSHNTRILTSYSRQFASTGNKNIWETGITYRFLFPAWRGKSK
ncbi:MAG TPA: hypothetical protein VN612_13125 [Acidobacteriaceae bacterium]|nr:hypothetical protein [Acidobacteriaceae bacterium]